ncbi:hypothetical protein FLA_5186 [Filimonas lacunae]|nr:hypothetical protein FLA_5186 [Filimonas lacunae]
MLLLTTALFISGAQAQKVDLDRYTIQYQYRDLPHRPISPNALSYYARAVVPGNISNSIPLETIEGNIVIDGLKWDAQNPAISVTLTASDLSFSDIEIKENVEIKKDKDGKETGRVYTYFATAKYSLTCTGKAVDNQGVVIYNAALGTSSTYTSSSYNNRREASEYWNNNRIEVKKSLTANIINNATANLSRGLSNDFGFPQRGGYDYLWILNAKKHPEHQAQQEAIEKIKIAFAHMTANESLDSFSAAMAPILDYFESVKTKYPGTDKADRKMRYSSYYNKAVIYMYLDMPEKAIPEAEALAANGYDERDGETLKKLATALNDLFLRNAKRSRHFAPQTN